MIVNLGPQFVQFVNGYMYLRFAGSTISARHSGQVAMSGRTSPPDSRMRCFREFERRRAARVEKRAFHALDRREARFLCTDPEYECVERFPVTSASINTPRENSAPHPPRRISDASR